MWQNQKTLKNSTKTLGVGSCHLVTSGDKFNKEIVYEKNNLSTSSVIQPSYTIRATIFFKCFDPKNSPKLIIPLKYLQYL